MDNDQTQLTRLKELLNSERVPYKLLEHSGTVLTALEGVEKGFGALPDMAPTFILKTENGFLAAVIRGDTRLSYKKIKQELHIKNVSLAPPELVKQITGSEVGTVSLIQPDLPTIVDINLLEREAILGGCGLPCFTLQINPRDLAAVTQARVFDFTEVRNSIV